MAATKTDTAAGAQAPAKKKSKALLFLLVGVVLLAGGGAGAWQVLRPKPVADAGQAAAAEVHGEKKAAAQYYKFDPAFVVNFGGAGNSRYLQVTVEAMTRDPAVLEQIKANEPAIRNDLVLLFSSQQYDSLVTAEGKEQLRADTLAAVRKSLAAEGDDAAAVENVYFTSLVIQ